MSTKKIRSLQRLPTSKLKEMCRDAKLDVSGTKAEMALRLTGNEEETPMSVKEVNGWLKKQGVTKIKDVSWCLRAGIQRGFIDISGDDPLNNVIISGVCPNCSKKMKATIGDLLYQLDYGGHDYEQGQEAPVKCPTEDCEIVGMYVTGLCCNRPSWDDGKYHNHCHICPGFGKCLGGYRSDHCLDCGAHFFSCSGQFSCHCKEPYEDQSKSVNSYSDIDTSESEGFSEESFY